MKRALVTGGTGTIGKALVKRLLAVEGIESITVFSRDEAKQWEMMREITDARVKYDIGDVRFYEGVAKAVAGVDTVFHCAAMKQVPVCESSPTEAALTNVSGAENIVRAIKATGRRIRAVACSTDKACLPSCVMGMTKAIQERIFLHAGFNVCRFGNVPGSRGSVIPLWKEQITRGEAITLTDGEMTRFLLPVRRAVDVMVLAAMSGKPGETFIPVMKACSMSLLAEVACSYMRGSGIAVLGPRPGEKKHEVIISREESLHAAKMGLEYCVIGPNSLSSDPWEYCSDDDSGMITEANALELMLRNEGVL